MHVSLKVLAVAAALAATSLFAAAPTGAQAPPAVGRNLAAAPAGSYKLDPDHASIIGRIRHQTTSYSTFRFYSDAGTLDWNPAHIEASKVDVTVDIKSLATPVPGFADRLMGERYFNLAKFPQARFVSTSIRLTGQTTGEITGDLTFLGVTKPITVKAELVGAGPNPRGVPTIGFEGTARFNRFDFGLAALPNNIGDQVELILDLEFNRQG
jgi:polyisoprenoid-binding protein YceI